MVCGIDLQFSRNCANQYLVLNLSFPGTVVFSVVLGELSLNSLSYYLMLDNIVKSACAKDHLRLLPVLL